MLALIFFYLLLPIMLGSFLIKFLKKSGALDAPDYYKKLLEEHPIEKKMFRAARVEGDGPARRAFALGDFENLPDTVDAIYAARNAAKAAGVKAAFVALNDKMEPLEQVDS